MAQSVGEKSGINAIIGGTPQTKDFVTIAAVSDMFEIESSKLATQRADALSKAFAARMSTDHTQTSNELKLLVSNGQVKSRFARRNGQCT
jgi:putative membrane protein